MRIGDLTTLRIGGRIRTYVQASTEQEVIDAVAAADDRGDQLLVLGGGSNLVASDADFNGTVVHLVDPGQAPQLEAQCEIAGGGEFDSADAEPEQMTPLEPACGGAQVTYFAGVTWDRAVRYAIAREMIGIEALSGIPGTVGATPIQNVGAYGQDVSATITRVLTWDRMDRTRRTFTASQCEFAYRDSIFKRTRYDGAAPSATGRYVVLAVQFQHTIGSLSAPIAYAELAHRLGVAPGERAPMAQVRDAVLTIRGSKGMVLDEADHDTWSAGSFFTNPILEAEQAAALPADAPRFPLADGRVKTSAAWLISHAGIDRGFAIGPTTSVSTKHSLALTNRGGATSDDLVALAHEVQERVRRAFGIRLVPEPVRLGVDL